jgi:putative tryptophan/tyrosine transport system substrate-binding protein
MTPNRRGRLASYIGRRKFLASLGGATVAWPLAAEAQQGERMRRIGVLTGGPRPDDQDAQANIAAFLEVLQQLGWADGRNLRMDFLWGQGLPDVIRKHSAELAALAPDVILASGTAALGPLLQATRTVPIVFVNVSDAVGGGLVDSLSRPGGNATGINFFIAELVAKRLELLRELVPKAVRVALLVNPANPANANPTVREVEAAARAMSMQVEIFKASTIREVQAAFEHIARERPDALFVGNDAFFLTRRIQLATLAARHALPTSFSTRDYAEAGGLMSYGTNVNDALRQMGVYTGRILKGEKPADLPVERRPSSISSSI